MHSALIWLKEKLAEKLLFSYTGEELTNTHIFKLLIAGSNKIDTHVFALNSYSFISNINVPCYSLNFVKIVHTRSDSL